MLNILIIAVFVVALIACIATGTSIVYALLFGYLLFFSYGIKKGSSAAELFGATVKSISSVKNILIIFALIGMITASWRACGTIAVIVYHASTLITPAVFLPIAFLLNCFVSVLTGTAFGTAATIGVICMAMANAIGVSPVLTGGAILSGAFFGDRCSPMSSSALLVCELTKTDIYRNIKNMLRSAALPFAAVCVIYTLLGLSTEGSADVEGIRAVLRTSFDLRLVTAAPAVLIIVLSLFRVRVKRTMAASIATAVLIAVFVQGVPVSELFSLLLFGYKCPTAEIAKMMSGGGITSMITVFLVVYISSTYAGLFERNGLLDGVKKKISDLSAKATPFGALLITSCVIAVVACNQALTIMLSHQLCGDSFEDKEQLALGIEDTAVMVAPIVPWSIAGAVPLTTVGAPTAAILAACYLYLVPLCSLISALLRARKSNR